jgi:hypothetical protein
VADPADRADPAAAANPLAYKSPQASTTSCGLAAAAPANQVAAPLTVPAALASRAAAGRAAPPASERDHTEAPVAVTPADRTVPVPVGRTRAVPGPGHIATPDAVPAFVESAATASAARPSVIDIAVGRRSRKAAGPASADIHPAAPVPVAGPTRGVVPAWSDDLDPARDRVVGSSGAVSGLDDVVAAMGQVLAVFPPAGVDAASDPLGPQRGSVVGRHAPASPEVVVAASARSARLTVSITKPEQPPPGAAQSRLAPSPVVIGAEQRLGELTLAGRTARRPAMSGRTDVSSHTRAGGGSGGESSSGGQGHGHGDGGGPPTAHDALAARIARTVRLVVDEWRWPVVPGAFLTRTGRCSCGDRTCATPGAHLLDPGAWLAASADPDRVREWWLASPYAAVVMPLGCHVDVIDAPENCGREALGRLEMMGYRPAPAISTGDGRLLFLVAVGARRNPDDTPRGRARRRPPRPSVLPTQTGPETALWLGGDGAGEPDIVIRRRGVLLLPPLGPEPPGVRRWLVEPDPVRRPLPRAEDVLGPLLHACRDVAARRRSRPARLTDAAPALPGAAPTSPTRTTTRSLASVARTTSRATSPVRRPRTPTRAKAAVPAAAGRTRPVLTAVITPSTDRTRPHNPRTTPHNPGAGNAPHGNLGNAPCGSPHAETAPSNHTPAGSLSAGSLPAGSLPAGSLPAGSLSPGSLSTGPLPTGPLPAGSLPPGSLSTGPLPTGSLPTGPLPGGDARTGMDRVPSKRPVAGNALPPRPQQDLRPAGGPPTGSAPAAPGPMSGRPATPGHPAPPRTRPSSTRINRTTTDRPVPTRPGTTGLSGDAHGETLTVAIPRSGLPHTPEPPHWVLSVTVPPGPQHPTTSACAQRTGGPAVTVTLPRPTKPDRPTAPWPCTTVITATAEATATDTVRRTPRSSPVDEEPAVESPSPHAAEAVDDAPRPAAGADLVPAPRRKRTLRHTTITPMPRTDAAAAVWIPIALFRRTPHRCDDRTARRPTDRLPTPLSSEAPHAATRPHEPAHASRSIGVVTAPPRRAAARRGSARRRPGRPDPGSRAPAVSARGSRGTPSAAGRSSRQYRSRRGPGLAHTSSLSTQDIRRRARSTWNGRLARVGIDSS